MKSLRMSSAVLRTLQSRCVASQRHASTSSAATTEWENVGRTLTEETKDKQVVKPKFYERTFSTMFPEFLPPIEYDRRHPLRERLERDAMLRRREHIDIPEFYVGSIVAVTQADQYAPGRVHRFLGIVIEKTGVGLKHSFILRNMVDGQGIQVLYNMYNPCIHRIEVIRLQRSIDRHMTYLKDALPEYSTFSQNMDVENVSANAPIPQLNMQVKMRPPPWSQPWEVMEMQGIDNESLWNNITPWFKNKFSKNIHLPEDEFDIVMHYREQTPVEKQIEIYEQMLAHEADPKVAEKLEASRRKYLFPKVETVGLENTE